jgi:hypothetical protein
MSGMGAGFEQNCKFRIQEVYMARNERKKTGRTSDKGMETNIGWGRLEYPD